MPTVPQIKEQRVRTAPFQAGRVTTQRDPAAFGAQSGRVLQTANDLMKRFTKIHDDSQINEAIVGAQKELGEYVQEIQVGRANEEGEIVGIQNPVDHVKLYTDKAEEIRRRHSKGLSPVGANKFSGQFGRYETARSLDVNVFAVKGIKANVLTDLDTSLSSQADQYVEETALGKVKVSSDAAASIDDAQTAGMLSPIEAKLKAQEWERSVEVASLRKMIRLDPTSAMIALNGGEFDRSLSVEQKQQWMKTASNEEEQSIRRARSEQEYKRRKQRQEQSDRFDETAKTGYEKFNSGDLDTKWVIKNRDNLSKADFKSMLDTAAGRGAIKSNDILKSDYIMRAHRGENVTAAAMQSVRNKDLTAGDFSTIASLVSTNSPGAKAQNFLKQGSTKLWNSTKPNEFTGTVFQRDLQATAMTDYQNWVNANPKATAEQVEVKVNELKQGATLIDLDRITINRPTTKHFAGTRNQPDFKQWFINTRAAKKSKKISDREYNLEIKRIKEWRDAFNRNERYKEELQRKAAEEANR